MYKKKNNFFLFKHLIFFLQALRDITNDPKYSEKKLHIVDIMHTENPVEDMKKVINWIYSGYHAY